MVSRPQGRDLLVLLVTAVLCGLGHGSSVGTSASIVAPALSVESRGLVQRAKGLHVAGRDLQGRTDSIFKDVLVIVQEGLSSCCHHAMLTATNAGEHCR